MAAVAFDPLEYAQQLEAAGMPRAQAEVVAKGLTAMFIHNFDTLVTKDYLDTRFSEFEARIDLRFVELESRMDLHFAESESRIDQRFAESESRTDKRFAGIDTQLARASVVQRVILAALAIPVLQTILLWVR